MQSWFYQHARIPARQFESYISGWTNFVPGRRSLADLVRLGKAPREFAASNDPERLVPLVFKPEDFMIAVGGDPLRSNCFVLPHNGMLGFPTTKKIGLPRQWRELLREARGR